MNDNIDTDQILPKQFLKLIDKKALVSILCTLGVIWTIGTPKILISSLTDRSIARRLF
ncbi:isopropylmalate isomerase small subunit [Streptococcus cristatus AS 1.3089]|uniref:Isopropylmalate isomerase small subunit n=1 Tax=Streptococcus cristatus AS 1.3089 TaxID=1302863 RepID=A0ABM5NJJ7_STRCR|nr:isopropylmalate isomerase small subunit [Streptococcus cristatus AS 1.3089]